jgi:hypothetical protein
VRVFLCGRKAGPVLRRPASALGHEQTSRNDRVVSVIPLKADINQRSLHVRLVPLADISRFLARAWHTANKKARELAHKDEVNADLLAFMEA